MDLAGNDSEDSIELTQENISAALDSLTSIYLPDMNVQGNSNGSVIDKPYSNASLTIVEQPQSRGFRFRYKCEGPSHGGLQGVNSEKGRKSYPSVQILNYEGPAKILVSLVTDDTVPKTHAHELVGKSCINGICLIDVKGAKNPTCQFQNIGVMHVTKRKVADVLKERISESMLLNKRICSGDVNDQSIQLNDGEKKKAKEQADGQAKSMHLNVVRLCFQAYLQDKNGNLTIMLPSVISNPIFDSKSPGAAALKICRMDKCGGCCTGKEEIFLLCEKVQKDDIKVLFMELDQNQKVIWKREADFGPTDVHKQYAIVFKTPEYRNINIKDPVKVFIKLERPSDEESSEPKLFTYYPQNPDEDDIDRKRRKVLSRIPDSDSLFRNLNNTPTSEFAGFPEMNDPSFQFSNSDSNNMNYTCDQLFPPEDMTNASVYMASPLNYMDTKLSFEATDSHVFSNDLEVDSVPCDSVSLKPYRPVVFDRDFKIPLIKEEMKDFKSPLIKEEMKDWKSPLIKEEMKDFKSPLIKEEMKDWKSPLIKEEMKDFKSPLIKEEMKDWKSPLIKEEMKDFKSPLIKEEMKDWKSPLIKEEMKDFKSPLIKEEMKDWKSPLIKEEMKDFKSPLVKKEEWKDSVGIKLCKTEKEKMSTKNVKSEFKKGVESCKEMKKLPAEVKTERPDPDLKKEPASEKKIPLHLDLLMSFRTFCASGSIKDLLMKNRSLMLIPDKYGDNCLHLALINNQSDVVQNLLPVIAIAPEDLNISNHRFQTGLHLAVLTNQPDMVELLLKQGIKRTLVDCNGNTAVHLAVKYDHIKCLKSLLKPDTQKHSLSDPFPDVDMLNCDGYSPLHLACLKGSIESVQLLIESKAEVNLPDGKSGRSPLHIAVEKNDLLLAGELLLEAECETECVTYDGNTPLHLACGREYDTMVALLLSVGADPEATSGMTDWCISDDSDLDSSTDEDQWIDDIKGTRPRDLVFNNEKILRLLNGEPYESISPDSDSDVQDFLGGDLCQLSDQMRLNLANLIDLAEGIENWKSLAKLLNVEYLIDEVKSAGCPTLCILDMYEMLGGQLKDLYSAFLKLEMGDAACLLNQLMR